MSDQERAQNWPKPNPSQGAQQTGDAAQADAIRRQMLADRPAPPPRSSPSAGRAAGGAVGVTALFFVLFKGKFLLTLLSMGASVLAYSWVAGLTYALGFTLLIFAHELGHVWAMRKRGLPVKAMLFIPFVGAFVAGRRGRTLGEEAFVALMGPVWGGAAGLLCLVPFALTQKPVYLTLLALNQLVNLANLAPFPPLDGSRILPLFAPKYFVSNAAAVLAASTDAERALYRNATLALAVYLVISAGLVLVLR